MKLFDRYVLKNILVASIFVSLTLSVVIFLTQSLRFLELVIESGASASTFWVLTMLALPRFFEIIVPLALMVATIFTYNRMTMDSEMVVARAAGFSPMMLARPAIVLSMVICVFLWAMTLWVAPKSLASMQQMRQETKAQFSSVLFREGVFNQVTKGLMVYIRKRAENGEMTGMVIYDHRDPSLQPSIILAKRGVIVASEGEHQVLVFDGTRQTYDPRKKIVQKLDFDRYKIELPDGGPVRQRWAEPDERTIGELLSPNKNSPRDLENLKSFALEIHRRFVAPVLAVSYTAISCMFLLLGPVNRRGQNGRVMAAILSVVVVQGLFLVSFNMAHNHVGGYIIMYGVVLAPLGFALFLLSGYGDRMRRKIMYPKQGERPS